MTRMASIIWVQDIRILLRGCPNKLNEISGEIPHSGRSLPRRNWMPPVFSGLRKLTSKNRPAGSTSSLLSHK